MLGIESLVPIMRDVDYLTTQKDIHTYAFCTIGNWLKRSSISGLADGVEDLLDISSVDRLSFIRQSSRVNI